MLFVSFISNLYCVVFKHCSSRIYMHPTDSWDIINLDSEAADNEESNASEVVQLQMTIQRYEEEKRLMLDEIVQLKEILKREVSAAESERKSSQNVINEYKVVRQRLDSQLNAANVKLDLIKVRVNLLEIS